MLIAQALLRPEVKVAPERVALLTESGYFDDIVSYYVCGLSSRSPESWELEDPEAWPAFLAELDCRFPPGPAAAYLTAFVQTIRDSAYAGLIDAKHALILNLRESHNLSEDDYSFLMSYYQLNRREDLYLDILAEALRQWPDNPNYCNDMGYRMLLAGEDPESAAALIRHALVFEPDNIYFLDSLAWYHYLVGEFEEALRLMDLPQRQDELPAEIAWHIGAIYLALEDYADARVWLQKCLDTGNDPTAEQEAREALELLP
jgi:tetratricopeptide (TPR) repeat protein